MNLFPLFMSSAVPAAPAKRAFRDQALEDEAQRASPVDSPTTSCRIDPETVVRSTAQEIVAGIARGTWTASQVLEVFIAQSLIAHAATNCITEVLFDFARKRATQLDVGFLKTGCVMGPLHGVPISVKDQYNIEGYDTTIGLSSCANKPAEFTADFVQSMLDAGAIPFVKTNVPQTMYAYECSNPVWGRTTNPYNA